MRQLTLRLVSLPFLACGREPAAPVVDGAAMDVVILQPTGGYDIYVYDVKSGSATQVTTIAGADEYNPSFSNNGKSIVHDVLTSFSHYLAVTDIKTGVSTPLTGGDGGNDAEWSPSGRFIAFDRSVVGDPSVYTVPASGGTPTLVRANAVDPHWGPGGTHLVVVDASDGSVRTINVGSGAERLVTPFGVNPAWSVDGRRIAYSDGFNIYSIAVDHAGAPVGPPVQLTFDGSLVFNQQPSWSNDGKTIVFHSNRGNTVFDFDLWVVPVSGGVPTLLTGTVGMGDYDPAYYGKKLVAFAGFTPMNP